MICAKYDANGIAHFQLRDPLTFTNITFVHLVGIHEYIPKYQRLPLGYDILLYDNNKYDKLPTVRTEETYNYYIVCSTV